MTKKMSKRRLVRSKKKKKKSVQEKRERRKRKFVLQDVEIKRHKIRPSIHSARPFTSD